jgi:hypothetical protein
MFQIILQKLDLKTYNMKENQFVLIMVAYRHKHTVHGLCSMLKDNSKLSTQIKGKFYECKNNHPQTMIQQQETVLLKDIKT